MKYTRNVIIVAYGVIVVVVASVAGMLGVMRPESGVTSPSVIITQAKPNPNPYQKLYEEMLYPVVRISTSEGVGSGVIFHRRDAEGAENTYILSAAHVVGHNQVVRIEFYDQTTINASVVLSDTAKDLALISVPITYSYVARLAPKNYTPYLFAPVWVVGCSLGLAPRPSQGIITAIPLRDLSVSAVSYWEISAPILPGNSGGPVYDAKTHEVIGIAVWVKVYNGQLVTTMAGIVPIQTVYEFLESVESKESNPINSMNFIDSLDWKGGYYVQSDVQVLAGRYPDGHSDCPGAHPEEGGEITPTSGAGMLLVSWCPEAPGKTQRPQPAFTIYLNKSDVMSGSKKGNFYVNNTNVADVSH